jgi:methionyl-tRNA formyltransferase
MRLAFMGTPEFAVPSLAELIASGHEIVAVYSQPPRPKGRGQKLTPSPIHAFAEAMGLPVFTPESMKSAEAIEIFQSLDLDAACVVAYGQILKPAVLEAPRLGCFNLHGSLLPRWRGAAPIQRAIMAGDRETGVQIMRMSEGLDEGAILLSEILPIQSDDTAASLSGAHVHDRRHPLDPGPCRHRTRRRDRDAPDRRTHLCEEDHPGGGPHRLDPPGGGGRLPHPRPVALPWSLVPGPARTVNPRGSRP